MIDEARIRCIFCSSPINWNQILHYCAQITISVVFHRSLCALVRPGKECLTNKCFLQFFRVSLIALMQSTHSLNYNIDFIQAWTIFIRGPLHKRITWGVQDEIRSCLTEYVCPSIPLYRILINTPLNPMIGLFWYLTIVYGASGTTRWGKKRSWSDKNLPYFLNSDILRTNLLLL